MIAILFYIILPQLIYLSLRFFTHNSSYRNIRFGFRGTAGESYRIYLLMPLLMPLTLGLIYPYWTFCRKRYFYSHAALGRTAAAFTGKAGEVYGFYMAAVIAVGVPGAIFIVVFAMLAGENFAFLIPLVSLAIYFVFEQFMFTKLHNYCWNNAALGSLRFESTLNVLQMITIRITNILAIMVSLGLLTPWAKIRRTRYILDNLFVFSDEDLAEFTAAGADDEIALGDAATEIFDIEIGL